MFMLGTEGGGLTLLSRILRRHPDVVSCSGNKLFWAGTDELQIAYFKSLPVSLRLLHKDWLTKRVYSDIIHPNYGSRVGWSYATDSVLEEYRRTEADFCQDDCETLQRLIKEFIRAYALTESPRFLDKSQSYTLKTPLLKRYLPDAKFVLISRNPYALCYGRSRYSVKSKSVSQIRQLNTTPEKDLRLRCNHFANMFRIGLHDLSNIDHIFIRYEDFLMNPETSLSKLLDYLGLSPTNCLLPSKHDQMPFGSISLAKWFPMATDVNSKYLRELSGHPKLIGIMEEILGPTAERLGYSPSRNVD